MTFAPEDLKEVRTYLIYRLDELPGAHRDQDLEPDEVGIVGDVLHRLTGGYHEGADDLIAVGRLNSDYSVRQSRDRLALTDAASALDIGAFGTTVNGQLIHHGILGGIIVEHAKLGDPRVACVREVIYTPDLHTVVHYDAIGEQHGIDLSHLTHTHISFWRDSYNKRWGFLALLREILSGTKGRIMQVLARRKTESHVWLCDGITRRWIPNEAQLADVRYLSISGQTGPLFYSGEIQKVDDLEAYGVPVPGGPVPAGTPEAELFPDQVDTA